MKNIIKAVLESANDKHRFVTGRDRNGSLIPNNKVVAIYVSNDGENVIEISSLGEIHIMDILKTVVPDNYNTVDVLIDTWYDSFVNDGVQYIRIDLEKK